jgi:hypothetical protein
MNKTIVQCVAICAVAVIAIACTAGQKDDAGAGGKNMALELRNMILSSEPQAADASDKTPASVIMDDHVGDAIASVMSSTGGDASIYLSSGGGMIGGVGHANVRSAAVAFTKAALEHKTAMVATTSFPYPEPGKVRFYLRTREGVFFAEAPRADLIAGTHPLAALFRAGQEVITQFRAVSGSRE